MFENRKWALLAALLLAGGLALAACGDDEPAADNTPTPTPDAGADRSIDRAGDGTPTPDTTPDAGPDVPTTPDVTPDVTPAVCGNGVREGAEQCDDGDANANTPNACRTNCTNPDCGDQIVDNASPYNEQCDDGNTDDTDGCTNVCMIATVNICDTCTTNADCGGVGNVCVTLDDGFFCGTACGEGCPEGFVCDDVVDFEGTAATQCIPGSGVCADCFDPDRDGYGVGPACDGIDCDQDRADINPAADEVCDGVDNNCDGAIDEGLDSTDFYTDADNDGHGDLNGDPIQACAAPDGYETSHDDCDDADPFTYPGAAELCDEKDNDCNPATEDDDTPLDWYPDADGDLFGDPTGTVVANCALVEGHALDNTDCDDGNGLVNPDADEICDDEVDNNCDDNADCADATCTSTPACTSDCVETGLEPNDSPDAASPITSGVFAGQHACVGNDDWYIIGMAANDTITVTVTFAQEEGDLDVVLYNSSGNALAGGVSEDDNEEFVFTAPYSGHYYLLVYLYAEEYYGYYYGGDTGVVPGNPYDLEIVHEAAPITCHDDAFEENDDLEYGASAIEAETYDDLMACEADVDLYSFPLNVGDSVTIDVNFTHADGNITARLYDPELSQVVEGVSETDNERLQYTAAVAGDYTLQVYLGPLEDGVHFPEGNPYTLTVAFGETPGVCDDDSFEENDMKVNAAPIGAGEFPALMACANDGDYYAIDLNTGDEIVVDLAFTHADGNIDLRLHNPAGVAVAASMSLDDNEHIAYTALLAGTFTLEVFYFKPGAEEGNPYDMTVVVNVPVSTCVPDGLEDNDNFEQAVEIEAGTIADLTSCDGDFDYYAIGLNAEDTLAVDLTFLNANANIDLHLYNQDSEQVVYSLTDDDNENVEWIAEDAGTFYIMVNLWIDTDEDPTNNGYSLTAAITPGVATCTDDAFDTGGENNDVMEQAAEVATGSYDLTVCEGDDDYFVADLNVGDEITVTLNFTDAEGDIDLDLLDIDGTPLDTSHSITDVETVNWTAVEAGPVFIYVELWRDDGTTPGNTYGMAVDIVLATPTCVADAFENNDTPETAWPIVEGIFEDLTICPDDEDYYGIDLVEGDLLSVFIEFTHAEGDADLWLMNPYGSWVDYSETLTDDEEFGYVATTTGTYAINVYLYEDSGDTPGNTYDMTVNVE